MAQAIEEIRRLRIEKLEKLKKLGVNPYKPVYDKQNSIDECLNLIGSKAKTAGRILSFRSHGKVSFADLIDETGKIQVMFRLGTINEKSYELLTLLDIGDFIGIEGEIIKTNAGEITISVNNYEILSKAIRPLPSVWYGLKDVEERFRKRYLDLILNREVKDRLDIKWKMERKIREFLWSKKFIEVETPVLQNLYGGTNAKPFVTHINSLDQDMYLRVAPELYLKRLIVGGYERVFEIARNFRNEGLDHKHHPEFTMLEWYISYADYFVVMDLVEEMMKFLSKEINGSTKIKMGEQTIEIGNEWPRKTMKSLVKEYLDINWDDISEKDLKNKLKEHHFEIPGVWSKNKALFAMFDHLVTPKLINPTWVIDYPREVSPLSKEHRDDPENFVERFEGYMGGVEVFDGWSEITSALEQRARFENEQKNLKAGDSEAQPLDEEFLEALEYGMPPLGGIGFGIDRLAMMFSNTESIREIIAFPLLKPEQQFSNSVKAFISENDGNLPDEKDKRFIAVLKKDVEPGKLMNALGHMTAGLAGGYEKAGEMCFLQYEDKEGGKHPNISHFPFIVLRADNSNQIRTIREEAIKRRLLYTDFTSTMTVGTSAEQVKATKETSENDLDYFGICLFGNTSELKEFTGKFSLFK